MRTYVVGGNPPVFAALLCKPKHSGVDTWKTRASEDDKGTEYDKGVARRGGEGGSRTRLGRSGPLIMTMTMTCFDQENLFVRFALS